MHKQAAVPPEIMEKAVLAHNSGGTDPLVWRIEQTLLIGAVVPKSFDAVGRKTSLHSKRELANTTEVANRADTQIPLRIRKRYNELHHVALDSR
jgi:hypothetical protein